MGRLVNALVVGAVAVLVAVAAVDALRGDEDEPAVSPAVRGELVYSDRECRRHALRLPDLARRDFRTVGCGVFTRYDNLGVKDGDVAWFAYPVPGGTTTLLTGEQLHRLYRRDARVLEAAWLRERRFVAVIAPGPALTIWEGARLLRVHRSDLGFAGVRASPSGRYFAALEGDRLVVFDRDGRPLPLPDGRAIAWSPGERFAAVAEEGRVLIVPAKGGEAVGRIPVDAVDLDWRR